MKVNEFIGLEVHQLVAFARYWESKSKDQPEQYPEDMSESEWFEQFQAFDEVSEN